MHHASPDQIIAHVDLLRAVDRLLKEAEEVRAKRDALTQLLALQVPSDRPPKERKGGTPG